AAPTGSPTAPWPAASTSSTWARPRTSTSSAWTRRAPPWPGAPPPPPARPPKLSLGKAEDLNLERLDAAAAALAGRATVAVGLPLLATKLFVPRPRPDLVPRPRLLARLDAGLDAGRCSLLSAPA